jgi:hypothetical protein
MNDNEIQERMRLFFGEDQFVRFTFLATNASDPPRLPKHLQEALESFRSVCPELPQSDFDLRNLLLYCHLHRVPLERTSMVEREFPSEISRSITLDRRSTAWYEASRQYFPHGHGGLRTICPQCVESHLKWLAENRAPMES